MFFYILGVWVVVVWNEVQRAFDILVPFDIETKLIFEVIAVVTRTDRVSSLQCTNGRSVVPMWHTLKFVRLHAHVLVLDSLIMHKLYLCSTCTSMA